MSAPGQREAVQRTPFPVAMVGAAAVLAAATIAWAAGPLGGGGLGTRPALTVAIGAGILSIAQLALTAAAGGPESALAASGAAARLPLSLLRALPWAELMTVAVVVLEALHKSRPWHTALLGVALVGYLIAVHLAENRASAGALRAQLPLLAAGAGLSALAVGAAALPGLPAGVVAGIFRIAALVAAVVVAGLAVPVWLVRNRR